jgi:hypothetical protein
LVEDYRYRLRILKLEPKLSLDVEIRQDISWRIAAGLGNHAAHALGGGQARGSEHRAGSEAVFP